MTIKVRLERFAFSTSQQYLLVFTDLGLKIYRNNAPVAAMPTIYTAADLQTLRFTQSTDTLIICNQNYPPYALKREGTDVNWTLAPIAFRNYPTFRYNIDFSNTMTPSAALGAITLTTTQDTFVAGMVGTVVNVNDGIVRIDSIINGLTANGTVIGDSLAGLAADAAWQEQAWSSLHGYPRSAAFYQNRLVFGGTRDAPSTVFASNTGDFYNFIETTDVSGVATIEDNNAFVFTLSSDQQIYIENMFGLEDLVIFTNQAEFRLTGGYQTAVTPKNVYVTMQSNYGCAPIPVFLVDLQIIYCTANLKEVRGLSYDYLHQRYQSQSYTVIPHQMFGQGKTPTSMSFLRAYSDTQSNYVCVTRSDGQLAMMTIDQAKDVQGWSRIVTQGFVIACAVVAVDVGGFLKDTLYIAVERANGTYIEAMNDPLDLPVYLDSWFFGTADPAQTHWEGLTKLANQVVQVVGDGTVQQPVVVSVGGTIDIGVAVKEIYVGLGYTSTLITMPYSPVVDGMQKRGLQIAKKRAFVNVYNTKQLNIDGYEMLDREITINTINAPLPAFTGTISSRLGGPNDPISTDPVITLTVSNPTPATVLGINTDLEVRKED